MEFDGSSDNGVSLSWVRHGLRRRDRSTDRDIELLHRLDQVNSPYEVYKLRAISSRHHPHKRVFHLGAGLQFLHLCKLFFRDQFGADQHIIVFLIGIDTT